MPSTLKQVANIAPSISVIIPNYNYCAYLAYAIESLLLQTVPFAEIIVVDDGSTDDSLKEIRKYESTVKVIAKENGGQLSACLAALAIATGEYIYVLDADDWVYPDMHECILKALQQRPAKIQFQLQAMGESTKGSSFPAFPKGYNSTMMREDNKTIGFYICPPTSGNVYCRKILDQIPLASIKGKETLDGIPTLLMPYMGEVVSLSKPLAVYTVHSGSMSGADIISSEVMQKEIDRLLAMWKVAKKILGAGHEPDMQGSALFLSERRLMIAVLQGRFFITGKVAVYLRDLWHTHYPIRNKAIFTAWGLSLLLPIPAFRKAAIGFRRNGTSRPQWVNRILSPFSHKHADMAIVLGYALIPALLAICLMYFGMKSGKTSL